MSKESSKRVLMLLDNPYVNDRRVQRESEALAEQGYAVTLVCCVKSGCPEHETVSGVEVVRLFEQRLFDIKDRAYRREVAQILAEYDCEVVHCHDQEMLNLGIKVRKLRKAQGRPLPLLIYDSHELFHSYPLNVLKLYDFLFLKTVVVRLIKTVREKWNSRYIDRLITVNDSLAEDLKAYFSLKDPALVLRNLPEYKNCTYDGILRKEFSLSDSDRILVFIGANVYPKTLNVEQVIREFKGRDGVCLIFIASDNVFRRKIEEFARKERAENVYFRDVVPPAEILRYLSSCDVGLVPTWNKKNLSYWYALDNKMFEYLMSEVPVLATQQPEYVRIVRDNEVGICVNPDQPNAYFRGFEEILSDYDRYKKNVLRVRRQLNWENEKVKLLEFYDEVFRH